MASANYEEPKRTYHPSFESKDADVVLRSTDDTLYRIPSFTLRNTSAMFREMLSQPQSTSHSLEPITVAEKDNVLERALRMICGLETPKWESFDELEAVLSLVRSWDAQGPVSVIRSAITAPLFLAEPLRLYVLATRHGWEEEARIASTYTLTLAVYDESHQTMLQQLPAKDLMALLNLHRRRRDEFKRFVDSDELFNAGNAATFPCPGCGENMDNHAWRELKSRMFLEMDQRPLGDTLYGLDMEEWPEAIACWSTKCRKERCGRLNYCKLSTLRDIKDCVARLPSTI